MTPPRRTTQRGSGRPRNTRPGQRGGASRTRTPAETRPRPRFTGRMAILVVVLAVLVVSYASSMRAYLQQRSQINTLKTQIASSESDIGALEKEKTRWKDPAYVEAQARQRFGWVLPGEVSYQMVNAQGKPLTSEDALTDPSTVGRTVPESWWSKAYGSLEEADHPAKPKPTPAVKITPPKPSATPTP